MLVSIYLQNLRECDVQAVCIDEEASQLGWSDLGQIERHRRLQHAHTHAGQEFSDQPVVPMGGEGLREDALSKKNGVSLILRLKRQPTGLFVKGGMQIAARTATNTTQMINRAGLRPIDSAAYCKS